MLTLKTSSNDNQEKALFLDHLPICVAIKFDNITPSKLNFLNVCDVAMENNINIYAV